MTKTVQEIDAQHLAAITGGWAPEPGQLLWKLKHQQANERKQQFGWPASIPRDGA